MEQKRAIVCAGNSKGLLEAQVAKGKQLSRGDKVAELMLVRDTATGEFTGNRESRRLAKALARRGRLG